jgi:hypothetical protein
MPNDRPLSQNPIFPNLLPRDRIAVLRSPLDESDPAKRNGTASLATVADALAKKNYLELTLTQAQALLSATPPTVSAGTLYAILGTQIDDTNPALGTWNGASVVTTVTVLGLSTSAFDVTGTVLQPDGTLLTVTVDVAAGTFSAKEDGARAATATFIDGDTDLQAAIFELANAPLQPARLRYLQKAGSKRSETMFIFNGPVAEVLLGDVIVPQGTPEEGCQGILKVPGQQPIALKALQIGPTTRAYVIPKNLPRVDEWEFYWATKRSYSNSIFINRPRSKGIAADTKLVLAGYPLQFHGLNLEYDTFTPKLRLETKDKVSYELAIDQAKSFRYAIYATVPANLPDSLAGETLSVFFHNGLPGSAEILLEETVKVVKRNPNVPAAANIPWAWAHTLPWHNMVDAVIGTADDTAAVEAAATQAHNADPEGGIVRLVGGLDAKVKSQTLTDACLDPIGNVIFYSDRAGVSISRGLEGDPVSSYPALVYWTGTKNMGFINLKLNNPNRNGGHYRVQGTDKPIDRFVMWNVQSDQAGTEGFIFDGKIFKNVHIGGGTLLANRWNGLFTNEFGPLTINNVTNVSVRNTELVYAIGQSKFDDYSNLWLEEVKLTRDATRYPDHTQKQARGISMDFGRNVYYRYITGRTTGTADTITDGERILASEGGGPHQRANGYSAVVSATSTKVVVRNPEWFTEMAKYGVGACLTIIGGKGRGQFRTIIGWDTATGTFTIGEPWLVAPDATSHVAVNNYALVDATFADIDDEDSLGPPVSIYRALYDGVMLYKVNGLRSQGLEVELGQKINATNGVPYHWQFTVSRNVSLRNCRMVNGEQAIVPASIDFIAMNDCPFIPEALGGGKLRGTVCFGAERIDCEVIGNSNPSIEYHVLSGGKYYSQLAQECMATWLKNNNDYTAPSDAGVGAFEGALFLRCKAPKFVFNEAAIYTTMLGNTGPVVQKLDGLQQPALATVTLTGNEVPTEALVASEAPTPQPLPASATIDATTRRLTLPLDSATENLVLYQENADGSLTPIGQQSYPLGPPQTVTDPSGATVDLSGFATNTSVDNKLKSYVKEEALAQALDPIKAVIPARATPTNKLVAYDELGWYRVGAPEAQNYTTDPHFDLANFVNSNADNLAGRNRFFGTLVGSQLSPDIRTSTFYAFCSGLTVDLRCALLEFYASSNVAVGDACRNILLRNSTNVVVGATCQNLEFYNCENTVDNPLIIPEGTTNKVYRNNVEVTTGSGGTGFQAVFFKVNGGYAAGGNIDSSISLPNSSGAGFQTMPFTQVLTDIRPASVASGWNAATHTYTIQEAGLYELIGKFRLLDGNAGGPAPGQSYGMGVNAANSDNADFCWFQTFNSRNSAQINTSRQCQAGEAIRLYVYLDGFGAACGGMFSVRKIG